MCFLIFKIWIATWKTKHSSEYYQTFIYTK